MEEDASCPLGSDALADRFEGFSVARGFGTRGCAAFNVSDATPTVKKNRTENIADGKEVSIMI